MLRADDVAQYFLVCQDTNHHEPITNLKLQKLCYYAQGIALVVQGRPLFHDDIKHWQYGPVLPNLDNKYKSYKSAPIPPPVDLDMELYDSATKTLLDSIYTDYGKYSAVELVEKTHEEPPWMHSVPGAAITHQQLREHFESLPNICDYFPTLEPEALRRMGEDPQVRRDLKRGIAAMKSGQTVPWEEMKERLSI